MRLLLLRHGVAEDAGPATAFEDEPRALTAEGTAKMQAEARGIERLALGIEGIISSPLVRCVQTATIVADALGIEPAQDRRLRPGADLDAVADLILEHPDTDTILLCGHQPDMSQLVFDLTGGSVAFKKGTLALMDVTAPRPNGAYLTALYPPATLRTLAG
jgi:phosphohistidine phosphatase SixA